MYRTRTSTSCGEVTSSMAGGSNRADPGTVLDLLVAFRASKAMFTGVSLGIFGALADAPRLLPLLAQELKANADALERLLDTLVGVGLLTRGSDGYRITPAATTYLCKNSPN